MKTLKTALRSHLTFALALLGAFSSQLSTARAQSFGKALSFDGTNQCVAVPTAAGSAMSGPMTVEAWVELRADSSWARLMDFGNIPSPLNNIVCLLSAGTSGQPQFVIFNGTSSTVVTSPSALPLNTWTHVAFTYDGTNGSIFINGILAVSAPMAAPPVATRTNNYIARSNFGDPDANVIVDDFRIWSVARSPAQIQASMGAPLVGNEAGLLLYYKFDSTNGTVATNSASATGAAYNGTLVNGPAWVPGPFAAPGDLDTLSTSFIGGNVNAVAVQPDGKILVGGSFGPNPYVGIERFNANGTLDTSFNANFKAPIYTYTVNCIAVQPDGKILIGGDFTFQSLASPQIARLNADGSQDTSFSASTITPLGIVSGTVYRIALQPDGKILIGGNFTTVDGVARTNIARLNATGGLDTGFNPTTDSDSGSITGITGLAVQPDGKILFGGLFTIVDGVARTNVARVNADGTLDTTFNPNPGNLVNTVAVQPDGKILIAGGFTTVGGVTRNRIARLNADGTLDTGFDPNANNQIFCLTLQADGRILLGGNFTTVGGTARNRVARVNADGTLDTGFNPNANNQVYCLALQTNGMVLIGGKFTTLQPNGAATATTRTYLARLLNDPATQTLSAPDTAHITWTLGGAGPELSSATFELSTDGGTTWGTPLVATRIGTTANWQVGGGFALPASGQLRARGVTPGGYYGSSGIIEQDLTYSGLVLNAPEIVVTGNGLSIADGDTTPTTNDYTDFDAAALGATTVVRTFTIANTGTGALNLTGTPKVVVSGANAADFAITLQPTTPVAAGGTTTFQVTFTPGAEGLRNAMLSLANDDATESPFNFAVTGRGLSFTTDTDGDGLSDGAELMGAALGFNWQVPQPALVQAYFGMANGAGLYTSAQVQALHVGTPLISRNPTNGMFKLTLSLQKSTSLSPTNWVPFPFIGANTSVNAQGQLEFQFTSPDNAGFYLLQAH